MIDGRSWPAYLLQQVGRDAAEQVKRRRVLVEDEGRAVLQRALQRVEAEDEVGQLGVLLEDRQRLGRFGLAFAADLGGLAFGVGQQLGRLAVGSERIFCASASPSYWDVSASTLRSEVMRSNTDWVTLSGSRSFLMPRNSISSP